MPFKVKATLLKTLQYPECTAPSAPCPEVTDAFLEEAAGPDLSHIMFRSERFGTVRVISEVRGRTRHTILTKKQNQDGKVWWGLVPAAGQHGRAPLGSAGVSDSGGGGGELERSVSPRPASAPGSTHRRTRSELTFPRSAHRVRSSPPSPVACALQLGSSPVGPRGDPFGLGGSPF